jgi:cytochrome c
MSLTWKHLAAAALAGVLSFPLNVPAQAPKSGQAHAMVKKAIEYLDREGLEKTLREVSQRDGAFVDGETYLTVLSMDGHMLAHPINNKLIGHVMTGLQDFDGRYFFKERLETAQKRSSFWQDYKFVNPVTKVIEPKTVYCETKQEMVFCAGFYRNP